MTIFDFLNSLLYTKKDLDLNVEDEQMFNLYMINRWCSMYSKEVATIINHTSNQNIAGIFDGKNEQFKFMQHLLPKVKFKRLNYIKKKKEPKTEEVANLKLQAKNKQISVRELKAYNDILGKLK
jgi:hypothetical protein